MSDDLLSESNHNPNSEQLSQYAETTPSQRVINRQTLSNAAKRRVDRATQEFTGKRCIIENTGESNMVDYAHCLPLCTKDALVMIQSWSSLFVVQHGSAAG